MNNFNISNCGMGEIGVGDLGKSNLKESTELKPGYRPPSPETFKNRDVFEETTWMYSRRVSGEGGLCRGARLAR